MSQPRHLIARTVLELDIGNLADVWGLQEEASHLFQQQVLPQIDRLFDRIVAADQVVRLDQVVVEVGIIDRRLFADEFSSYLLAALNRTLSDLIQSSVRVEHLVDLQHASVTKRDRTSADWEVLLYFLQYGRLPWWVSAGSWQDWLSRWEIALQNSSEKQRSLQRLIATHSNVQQRLIEQFPESFRHQLIVQLQPGWAQWSILLTQARHLMQLLGLRSSTVQQLERQAWRSLLLQFPSDDFGSTALPAVQWMQDWLEALEQAYQAEVAPDVLAQHPNFIHQRLRNSLATLSSDQALWHTALDRAVPSIEPLAPRSDLAVWLTFLQQGRLPLDQDWQTWLTRWELLMQADGNWRQSIRKVLATNSIARSRFIEQFPEPFRHQLIVQLQPMWIDWYGLLTQSRQLMQSINLTNTAILEQQAWQLLLSELGSEETPLRSLPTATWIRNWLAQLVLSFPETQYLRSTLEQADELAIWLTEWEAATTLASMRKKSNQTTSAQSPQSPEEQDSGIYLSQAGLVLLHPFLSIYFGAIDLLDGNSFQDELSQQSAIYLLHYLATQQTDAPESELVLPKLLCGWALDRPVIRGIELPHSALQEGDRLLQTVINYWEVLKNTSPDGLREGFLQRQGKLTQAQDGNWTLRVEQSSIDILLDRLPWGLSMVKLPWMAELLIVEWT